MSLSITHSSPLLIDNAICCRELKKALVNDYKEFGEPLLVREPPRRNTLKVSDFQALVDSATASGMVGGAGADVVKVTKKPGKKAGKKSAKK